MTVIAIYLRPETVIAAADTAVFNMRHDMTGQQPKLALNPLIGAVGTGTGSMAILTAGFRRIADATDFDRLPLILAGALREAAVEQGGAFNAHPGRFLGNVMTLAGWSIKAGRMLAYRFAAASFFAPELTTRLLSPDLPDFPEVWSPDRQGDVIRVAREQNAKLPNPGRGVSLTIAMLRPGRIEVDTIPDYATDTLEREVCLSKVS